MRKLSRNQKTILGEFLGNFALAWISFGLIAPVFAPIDSLRLLIVRLIISLAAAAFLLRVSFYVVK